MNRLKINLKILWLFVVTTLVTFSNQPIALGVPSQEQDFEVNLYSGVTGIAQLGASYKSITENTRLPFNPIDITEDPELLKTGIVYGIAFETIGAKIYFKRTGSCLISLTPPFKGPIKTKKIQLFESPKPAELNWTEFLIQELGQPNSQGTGGLFGGDIFYYPWGDIEVSRIGLRQLMLYRDRSISEFRHNVKMSSVKPFKK